MPLTMDNLDLATKNLLDAVQQATNEEDQSLENIDAVAVIFDEIVENNTITPTNTVRSFICIMYMIVPSRLHVRLCNLLLHTGNSSFR